MILAPSTTGFPSPPEIRNLYLIGSVVSDVAHTKVLEVEELIHAMDANIGTSHIAWLEMGH